MRISWITVLAGWAFAAYAQPAELAFRDRVVQLALIYGESSGIDLDGAKVEAREVRKVNEKCSDVEIVVSKDGSTTRETVRACKPH
jgi:hypothetical protein